MKNISFDNPYLLLVFIPLLIAILVPFILAFRKGHKGKGVIASLILHILIAACACVAAANPSHTRVITQTEVIVVADASYSANGNFDVMDGYIDEIGEKLPKNARLGLVCFGRDYKLATPLGGEIVSVATVDVDDSATDISSALDYASTLFGQDSIKRIVLITDGKETNSDATAKLVASIERLYAQNIYLDAIYVDDNISVDTQEVQIGGVEFKSSTYVGQKATANALLQSNNQTETPATVYLYQGDQKIATKTTKLTKGYNIVNFPLNTADEGEYDYEIRVATADDTADTSVFNNAYRFTQKVTSKLDILLVSTQESDLQLVQETYGETAKIHPYINTPIVPCVVEELCLYDEIVLSNIDVRKDISNATAFVDAVNQAVAKFGKSLIVLGDTKLQEKQDDALQTFEDMLPVRYGNADQDAKVYTIVIDTSRSMQFYSRFKMMKDAAKHLVNLLSPEDHVIVISFSGVVESLKNVGLVKDVRAKLLQEIGDLQPTQGTFLGLSMQKAYEELSGSYYSAFKEKQVMLISDGMSYSLEPNDPVEWAAKMKAINVFTSVINTNCTEGGSALQAIAAAGAPTGEAGRYYVVNDADSIASLIFEDVANEITETVIEAYSPVKIKDRKDDAVDGLLSVPGIYGYVSSKAKANATTVLTATYERASGTTAEMPLYAHWDYGNGRVAVFTSTLTGAWSLGWAETDSDGRVFFENMFAANTPQAKVDYPYTMHIDNDGTYATVYVTPATLKADGKAVAQITFPDGTTSIQQLTFDSTKYFYKFATPDNGKYSVEITYTYADKTYVSQAAFNISYSPEYDSFTVYNAGSLYSTVRNRGTVTENAVPSLENNDKEVATYEENITPAVLIATIVLFIVDIIVRKVKWKDITNLFKRKKKGGAK